MLFILLLVEAKCACAMDMDGAVAQLFGYMAILYKFRKGSSSNPIDKDNYGMVLSMTFWSKGS